MRVIDEHVLRYHKHASIETQSNIGVLVSVCTYLSEHAVVSSPSTCSCTW
jgi:hypothetical protein